MKKLLFTVAIGLGLLTQSCQKETITTNPNLAKVGDKYLDGYVVSTYSDGHGVIAKKVSGSTNWYSCGTLASGEWRVPSSSELYYMLDNMTLRSKMNISYGYYWSADENSSTNAKAIYIEQGGEPRTQTHDKPKTNNYGLYIFKN